MSSELTERELEEAAAEAGISPTELKVALAKREGADAFNPERALDFSHPPELNNTYFEAHVARYADQAAAAVCNEIESQTGKRGAPQGPGRHVVVDYEHNVSYLVRTAPVVGTTTSLVRIDLDPSLGRAGHTVGNALLGAIGGFMALTGLIAGAPIWGGVGLGLLATIFWRRRRRKKKQKAGVAKAQIVAAQAIDVARGWDSRG
jgi:hypothetical protein